MNFKNALNNVISAMCQDPKNEDGFCCAIYWDDICNDNAMVMFMEYEAYGSMHEVMKELHKELSAVLGHPVSICHNHPSDENVLIHGAAQDASVYYSDACCKEDTIRCCLDFLTTREGYMPDIQALALLAESIYERSDEESIGIILERLNWNEDPLQQLVKKELGVLTEVSFKDEMATYLIKCRGIKPLIMRVPATAIAEDLETLFYDDKSTIVNLQDHQCKYRGDQRYEIAFQQVKAHGLPTQNDTFKFIAGRHNLGSITNVA